MFYTNTNTNSNTNTNTNAKCDTITNSSFVFEDSDENDIVGAQRSDGPGTLKNYVGEEGIGLWLVTVVLVFVAAVAIGIARTLRI